MPLAPGRRLGPYEIVASLGAGGMGEVYEARDTRLGRTVAIKVLPEELAADPARRARFEREARAVSQLTHPHVCTLHDVGEAEGVHFLVLEHCEGETLAGRLERGALSLENTLRYGAEIAEALDAAHRQGVTHRDLKPANVVLTPSGAKLLDFGLARLAAGATGAGGDLPTVSADADHALTAEGTVLGTYPYMAPEQVEGAESDSRSDLFSLGAVLHEMATGRRAFEGRSAASIMAAVLKEEPEPLSRLQPVAPPALDHVVSRCLAKDPEERWQSAKDVAAELRWIAGAGSQAGVAAPLARRKKSGERLAWGTAALAVATLLALAALWSRGGAAPERLISAGVPLPPVSEPDAHWGLELSPDGRNLALVFGSSATGSGANASLWIHPLDGASARPLAGFEGAILPFWSPDGRHLAFFADGQLHRIPVGGGPPQPLAEAPSPRGGSWSEDGVIVFNGNFREGLFRIPAAGGEPVELTRLDEEAGEISHRWPHFLPGGRKLLFLVQRAEGFAPDDRSTIEALDLATGEREPLLRANSSMAYAPTGHLLFWRQGTLLAQPFDLRRLELSGEARPVVGDVGYSGQERAAFSIAGGDLLVYQEETESGGPRQPVWFDRQGRRLEEAGPAQQIVGLELSHGGDRTAHESAGDIWIRELESGGLHRLTFHPAPDFAPIWSPDDRWIVFASFRQGSKGTGLYRKLSSGAGEAELLAEFPEDAVPLDWSLQGDRILFRQLRARTISDLGVLTMPDGEARDLVRTPADEFLARFSPDGRWIVYNAEGAAQPAAVFVTGADGAGGRWQISRQVGFLPRWSRDGREIFYLEPPNRLMVAEVTTADGFRHGPPRLLFELPGAIGPRGVGPYAEHPSGDRFLFHLPTEEDVPPSIRLVLNWPELLKR